MPLLCWRWWTRDDGKHRPYGLMVLQIEGDLIAGIVGFPDPWPFEQCGLPPELTYRSRH